MHKLLTVLFLAASVDAAPRWTSWDAIHRIFPQFQMLETIVAGAAPAVPTGASSSRSLPNTNGNYLSNTTCYLSAATDFTIAFWVKAGNNTQASTYMLHLGGNSGELDVLYGYDLGGNVGIYADSDGGYSPSNHAIFTILDTNWHHVAFRHSGSTWSYFLDGTKSEISTSASFTLKTNTTSCSLILGRSSATSAKFLGSMGRLLISSAALTDGQIAALAGSICTSSGTSGVTGYWPLLGATSPEPEASPSPNANSLTMTGTVAQDTTGPTCSSQ